MKIQCNVEDCIAVMCLRTLQDSINREMKDVFVQLNGPNGEQLSEIKIPWPDGEPEPSEIKYLDTEECIELTNNATCAAVPIRISRLHDVLSNLRPLSPPKRFTCFSNPPCPQDGSGRKRLHSALKKLAKEPLADETWKEVTKYLSAKGADVDGFLTKNEQNAILHSLPVQTFTPKELRNICEILIRTNVFGPSCLGAFYELCLSLGQVSLVRSVIHSSNALTENCLAVFLNFVATLLSVEKPQEGDNELLACLLQRQFDPRRLSDVAARKITTRHASILLRACMDIYVVTEHSFVAEQALELMSVLTDTFGSRLIWENDLQRTAVEALEFFEKMSDIISSFKQIDVERSQTVKAEEDDFTLYKVEKISLPCRPLNW